MYQPPATAASIPHPRRRDVTELAWAIADASRRLAALLTTFRTDNLTSTTYRDVSM